MQKSSQQCQKNHDSKRMSWKEWKQSLPAFLDASSSVSASAYGARRLPELKALYQATISNVESNDDKSDKHPLQSAGRATSKRHLRRRTTSYNSYKRHRFPTAKQTSTSKSRKARRKPSILRQQHSAWQQDDDDDTTTTTTPSHWLPTHFWHAKRFHMAHNLFGWSVPLQHSNRGRQAAHRLLHDEHRTLLQDVTWKMQPLVVRFSDIAAMTESMRSLCPSFHVVQKQEFFGQGILHEPNAFPMDAIGPIEWWIPVESKELWLFVHPSIQSQVKTVLASTFTGADNASPLGRLKGGIACFQVRGVSSTDTISEALSISLPKESLSHLQVTVVTRGDSTLAAAKPLMFDTTNKNTLLCVRYDHTDEVKQGWNIFCPVAEAHEIFLALTLHANAVVIGCVEEYAVMMDNKIFPRDYPDCEQGRLYWEASSSNNNNNKDWLTFRAACECKTERLKPKPNNVKACYDALSSIVGDDTNDSTVVHPVVVVVRGAFGQPFVDLLQQCARVPFKACAHEQKRRRPRRTRGETAAIRLACLISTPEAEERIERVMALTNSLSLAAMIQCQIQIRGRGTLQLGDEIVGCSGGSGEIVVDDKPTLGYVTGDGSFVGGAVQGTGFVGAARLLHFLASHHHPAMMFHNGQLHLVVQVCRRTETNTQGGGWKGILTLLL